MRGPKRKSGSAVGEYSGICPAFPAASGRADDTVSIQQQQNGWYRSDMDLPYIFVRISGFVYLALAGKESVTQVPSCSVEVICMLIERNPHSLRHRYSPMPVLPPFMRPLLPVNPRSKTRGSSWAGMPIPLSDTLSISSCLSESSADMIMTDVSFLSAETGSAL